MKNIIFSLFLFISFSGMSQAQSLSDLKNIEKLKKEIEKIGAEKNALVPTVYEASALQTFMDSLSVPPAMLKTALDEFKAEKPPAPVKVSDTGLKIFGSSVFKNARVDFSPEVYGPVDQDYPLGPGDEIIITVWGEVELRHDLVINREGQVYIENIGLVKLSGLPLSKATKKLKKFMGRAYSSLLKGKAIIDVSIGKLRSIRL